MNIENYFTSEPFLDISNYFINITNEPLSTMSILVHIGTLYYQLFNDEDFFNYDKLNTFIHDTISEYISNFKVKEFTINEINYQSFIKDKFYNEIIYNIKDINQIIKFIEKNAFKKYIFHSCKETFLDSIKKNGINPNIKLTNQNELDEIDNIFIKHGIDNILGFQKINCENQISYSESSLVSYSYAARSPEWFSEFTGYSYAYNNCINDSNMEAYIYDNYEVALNNLISIMTINNFNNIEIKQVLDFFDKNWKMYTNKKLIIIMLSNNETITLKDNYYNSKELRESAIKFMLDNYISNNDLDVQSYDTIDINNANIIYLPTINDVINHTKKLQK